MPQIGSIQVDVLRGRPARPVSRVEAEERLGVDGAELAQVGLRERTSTLTSVVAAADATAAATTAASHEDAVGGVVTILDADGLSHSDCLIEAAEPTILPAGTIVGHGGKTRIVRTRWTVRKRYV